MANEIDAGSFASNISNRVVCILTEDINGCGVNCMELHQPC